MKTNVKRKNTNRTHEGAPASMINAEQMLRRSVLACMLWEDEFYEDGMEIAQRIKALRHVVKAETLADLAIEARNKYKLRHVSLLLLRELCRHTGKESVKVHEVFPQVIMRADELAEFLALYWKEGREKLAACAKKGLAKAFVKFSAYDLAKYNRDNAVKLRDVLFLCHAKPKDEAQAETWKQLVDGKLQAPDTWEVALSAGADKRETWERLMKEKSSARWRSCGTCATCRNPGSRWPQFASISRN